MTIDKKYIDQIIKVSSKAAYASFLLVGKNDKIAADKAAVDAMRTELNMLDMNGKVVIGEGELDEAPMLYIGEMLGTKKGPDIDIAVDPVEGTNFAANLTKCSWFSNNFTFLTHLFTNGQMQGFGGSLFLPALIYYSYVFIRIS